MTTIQIELPEATAQAARDAGLLTPQALERMIDEVGALFDPPSQFAVPGQTPLAAQLDLARTVARRAERDALPVAGPPSHAGVYLNRLSDLLWTMARWQESASLLARDTRGVAER